MQDIILVELEPFKEEIVGIVVESTFNWYWLVDCLMDVGYRVHLANPAGIQKHKGLKYRDDQYDSFWLAHLLWLNILLEGYIYPKEDRPVRDLLRKRGHLVRLRTSLIISLQGIISRTGIGKILSLTIMLETGSIKRFTKVGNFSSYCRKVPTSWTSNNKKER